MSQLQEIFKDQPELLNEPAVKALIQHFEKHYNQAVQIATRKSKLNDKIFAVVIHSERMIVQGTPSNDVVDRIVDIISKEY